jgi:hypothetical protein
MNRLARHYEKFLLALAAAGAVASGGWFWQQEADVRLLRAEPVAARLTGSVYELVTVKRSATVAAVWPEPKAQSQGAGWLYEVFTPPVIYYDARANSFVVSLPHDSVEGSPPAGLELIEVKREPYRLQLAGYFGVPGNYLVAFTSAHTPGTLLAREGHRFEDLGLRLVSFTAKKIPVPHPEARPAYEAAAFAVMQDEETGGEVILDSRAARLTDTPLAVFQSRTGAGPRRELHEGEIYAEAEASYRIERIQLDPPEVAVVRLTAGLPWSEPELLHPAGRKTAEISNHPAAGLTVNRN